MQGQEKEDETTSRLRGSDFSSDWEVEIWTVDIYVLYSRLTGGNDIDIDRMASLPWRNILSGAIFGAALTAAGMYSPSTIIEQMNFTSFHMMKGFLSASATSA